MAPVCLCSLSSIPAGESAAKKRPKFIEGDLAARLGLLSGKEGHKQKTFLTIENYVHLYKSLWCNDFYDFMHKGARVDAANILNTYCFTLARLAEVCQAKYQVIYSIT